MKKTTPSRSNNSVPRTTDPTNAQIQARAYELYIQGGRQEGRHNEHWLRAEKELREELVMQHHESVPTKMDNSSPSDAAAPTPSRRIQPLDEREYPFARGKRGTASREEIRTQQVHQAGRGSR